MKRISRMTNELVQHVQSNQFKGFFDKKIKQKIALEEFMQSELEYQQQQHEQLLNLRVILVEALFQRPNNSISGFWYEFTDETVWIFASYQIVKKLDQNLFSLFTKLIVDTVHLYAKYKDQNKTILDCEKEALRLYIDDMNRIRSTKAVANADRLKQVLFLLVNQYFREKNMPILDSKNIVPINDTKLYEILDASFSRLKHSVFDYQRRQDLGSIRLRMIPYVFQGIIQKDQTETNDINPLRLKVAHSIINKSQGDKHLSSIIVLTSQFVELLDKNSKLLDYILAYEIISIEQSLKFNRGAMEQEILSMVSRNSDASERSLYNYFSKEEINEAKTQLEQYFNILLFEKKVGILRILD